MFYFILFVLFDIKSLPWGSDLSIMFMFFYLEEGYPDYKYKTFGMHAKAAGTSLKNLE